jgi:hypothetical protein
MNSSDKENFGCLGIVLFIIGAVIYVMWLDSTPEAKQSEASKKQAEIEAAEKKLPTGCKLVDAGYAYGEHIVLVVCDGKASTTAIGSYQSGKYRRTSVTVFISEI